MATEGDEDFNSVVDCINSMFNGVINRDAIITIVESCGGNLNLSVDAVMKITSDTENNGKSKQPEEPVAGADQALNVGQNEASISYSSAIQNSSKINQPVTVQNEQSTSQSFAATVQSYGAVPKVRKKIPNPSSIPWNDQMRRIVEYHNKGSRTLILMRGAPGSGKTHLAQKIVEMLIGGTYVNFRTHICSTDDYFMYRGKYHFNKQNLSEAHSWNQNRARAAMEQGLSPLIIDNTNIELWEMEIYARYAIFNGYIIEVVEPQTPWAKKANQLARRNIHNVPIMSIKRMLDNYVNNITGDDILQYFCLTYPSDWRPPVLRSMPVYDGCDEKNEKVTATDTNNTYTSQERTKTTETDTNNTYTSQERTKTTETVTEKGHSINEHRTSSHSEVDDDFEETIVQIQHELSSTELSSTPEPSSGANVSSFDVTYNNDKYMAVQKQLEQLEKVEQEWENGESWEEGEVNANSKNCGNNNDDNNGNSNGDNHDIKEPRPHHRRENTTNPRINTEQSLVSAVNKCQDWTQISLFMPPWNDDSDQVVVPTQPIVVKVSASTRIEVDDFNHNKNNLKILATTPRDINQFHMSFQSEKIPTYRSLDKSTMTNEEQIKVFKRCEYEESHFVIFRKLFKNVSRSDLRHILDQCVGDVNWAVEIVLEGVASKTLAIIDEDEESEEEEDSPLLCNCLSYYNVIPDTSLDPKDNNEDKSIPLVPSNPGVSAPKKSRRLNNASAASIELKKQIEQNVSIDPSHYSEHCYKLKQLRHGEPVKIAEVPDDNQPSTSGESCGKELACIKNTNDDDGNLSDDEESVASYDPPEKTVNINLGHEFVNELDRLFGRSDMSYPDKVKPSINIPLSLLNNINALWMESLMHQLDAHDRQSPTMLKEDEEYARVLAMKEAEFAVVGKPAEVLDFKEIMDMELALSIYQRDVAEWKNKEPNDLAAKLTREKLYNIFPDIPQELLAELLMAHDNNFQTTVENLLVSTGKISVLNEKDGINKFVTAKEMERQSRLMEAERKALQDVEWPLLPKGEVPDMEVVNNYRSVAERHLQSRNANIQKASEYVGRGLIAVASYYRELAEFHKRKYELYNSLAAASLMQLHAAKCPDNATIDLHYLRVAEAKESLDLFIDTHIQKLKSLQGYGPRHNILYFITGRGLHSNGKPRVKPAVQKRLRERGLYCNEVNPGLLSARVTGDHKLTHQIA